MNGGGAAPDCYLAAKCLVGYPCYVGAPLIGIYRFYDPKSANFNFSCALAKHFLYCYSVSLSDLEKALSLRLN